jgi:hypothetical protein
MTNTATSVFDEPAFAEIASPPSPLDTKLGVRFVLTGVLHSDAWEGSCRVGNLEDLTHESEKAKIDAHLSDLKKTLAGRPLPPEVELIEPASVYSRAEGGNPDIRLPEEQLLALQERDAETDVYVVTHPHEGVRIAQRYRKPVIILQQAGWAVDMPAAIRAKGISSFHAEDMDAVFGFLRLYAARKALARTSLLNVTNFPNRQPFGVVSAIADAGGLEKRYGLSSRYLDYKRFFGMMDRMGADRAVQDRAGQIAGILVRGASSCTMTEEEVASSVLFYLTALEAMRVHGCNAFTIECFELCSALEPWNRRFTPCLAHALLKDRGYPSACEGDLNALLAMMLEMYVSRQAVYMGNPTIDRKTNILNIHHSVASLRMQGVDGGASPYAIHHFANAGFGATLRHDFAAHEGEAVTVARFDPSGTRMLTTRGTVAGGGGLDGIGCSQYVDIRIPNGYEFWRESQNFGHHLAFVYGDHVNQMRDLGDILNFEVLAVL